MSRGCKVARAVSPVGLESDVEYGGVGDMIAAQAKRKFVFGSRCFGDLTHVIQPYVPMADSKMKR